MSEIVFLVAILAVVRAAYGYAGGRTVADIGTDRPTQGRGGYGRQAGAPPVKVLPATICGGTPCCDPRKT